MNNMIECQHVRQSLGVYVLGAIDPAERSVVDAHLAGCQECREELAGLAGLPALLGRVPMTEAARIAGFDADRLPPGDVPEGEPPSDDRVLTPLLNRIAHRRRVNRWRGLVEAAAVALVAAGSAFGAVSMSGPAGPPGHWDIAKATSATTHAHVEVKYAPTSWGTMLESEVSGIPAGTICEFWVIGANGREWEAGSWTVLSSQQSIWYPGSTSVPAHSVQGFEVTSGSRVLVHASVT